MSIEEGQWEIDGPRLDAFRDLYEVLPDVYGPGSSFRDFYLNSAAEVEPFKMVKGSKGVSYLIGGYVGEEKYVDTVVAFTSDNSQSPGWHVNITRAYDGVTDGSNSEQIHWEGPIVDDTPQASTLFTFIAGRGAHRSCYSLPTGNEDDLRNPRLTVTLSNGQRVVSKLFNDKIQQGRFITENTKHLGVALFANLNVPIQITPGLGITDPEVK
ncbi:MAG: hypothetical protein O3B87_03745 [bacterium]|nr:hypothetical protein [bacterium]